MKFISLEPFIPSGANFEGSKEFFQELGFKLTWDSGGYVGFETDGCKFILQDFHNPEFAQNLMLSVKVDNVTDLRKTVIDKKLPERFGIKIGSVTQQPYGKEVNVIDLAGVCWHFVE